VRTLQKSPRLRIRNAEVADPLRDLCSHPLVRVSLIPDVKSVCAFNDGASLFAEATLGTNCLEQLEDGGLGLESTMRYQTNWTNGPLVMSLNC